MGPLDIWAGSPVDVGLGAESRRGGPGQARHTPLGLGTSVDQQEYKEKDAGPLEIWVQSSGEKKVYTRGINLGTVGL